MSWRVPFVVYRLDQEKKPTEVYECEDLKQAKYWIQYIAEPGDVLCCTPLNAKHTKASQTAEYWCHKESSGKLATDPTKWWQKTKTEKPDFAFPSEHQS